MLIVVVISLIYIYIAGCMTVGVAISEEWDERDVDYATQILLSVFLGIIWPTWLIAFIVVRLLRGIE